MPHDMHGIPISVGDRVRVPAVVVQVTTGEEYCNVTLATELPMFPGEIKTSLVLNAKQVEKVLDHDDDARQRGVPVNSSTGD